MNAFLNKILVAAVIVFSTVALCSCNKNEEPEESVYGKGGCTSISSCDFFLPANFVGCAKKGNTAKVSFNVTNTSGKPVSGLKLWMAPVYTYVVDNLGNIYNKENGLYAFLGDTEGIGDLMVPLPDGATLNCTLEINNVDPKATSFKIVHAQLYNSGTGDWECSGKSVILNDVTWD